MITRPLNFKIGAVDIGLAGNPSWEYTRIGCFDKFLSAEIPQAIYKIKIDPPPIEPSSLPIFDTRNGWRLYRDNTQWVIWVPSLTHIPYLAGRFDLDFHSGEIFTSESDQEPGKFIFPISYPMGELLMTNLLGTGYGIMLHSCGVVDGEEGIVFAGTSGAGKTTTARLWYGQTGVRVLNDDHTIIRKINGKFQVHGTPWYGQGRMALSDDASLKKIIILKHALSNQTIRLSPVMAAAALLVRTFAPLWSAPAMDFTMQFLDELCQTVPCYELGFVPDQSVIKYVRCLSLS